jgi:Ca2+:H+ antiporter
MVFVCARRIISSLGDFSASVCISESFIVFVLLPVLGHPLDVVLCTRKAMEGDIEFAINLALETIVGLLSFLNPMFVLLGSVTSQPYAVAWQQGQLVPLALASIGLTFILANGQSNWFSGVICIALYVAPFLEQSAMFSTKFIKSDTS